MACSPSVSSVHGILQARILEWIAVLSSRGSSHPGIEPKSLMSPALAAGFFTTSTTWEAYTCANPRLPVHSPNFPSSPWQPQSLLSVSEDS